MDEVLKRHHVSRKDLEGMAVGQTVEFILSEDRKMESAKSTCDQMKRIRRGEFSCKFGRGELPSVIITRLK